MGINRYNLPYELEDSNRVTWTSHSGYLRAAGNGFFLPDSVIGK